MLFIRSLPTLIIVLLLSTSAAFIAPRAPKTVGRSSESSTTTTTTTSTCIDEENHHRLVSSSSSSLNSAVIFDDQDYFPQQPRSRTAQRRSTKSGTRQQVPPRVAIRPVALQAPLTSLEQFDDYIKNHGTEKYTVVKFYASWCKTCAKFGLKFNKLVATHGDWVQQSSVTREGSIRFASVEYTSNPEMFTELEVSHLPTIHIYDSDGNKVVDTTCQPSKFSDIASHITHYVDIYKNRHQVQPEVEQPAVVGSHVAIAAKAAVLKSIPTMIVEESGEHVMDSASDESMSTARTVLAIDADPFASSSLLQSIIDKEVVESALEASYRSRSFDETNNFSFEKYQQPQTQSETRRPRWWRKLPKVVSIIFQPRL